MQINYKNMKISELCQKYKSKIFIPTDFQRQPDAWTKKTKRALIKSIIENFYIPPLLFSENEILDGLQRMSCVNDFIENEFDIFINDTNDTTKKCFFSELDSHQKNKFLDHELITINLTDDKGQCLPYDVKKELFWRINTNSIQLNKGERIFAKCSQENRNLFLEITKNNEHLNNLAQNKKGKRFSLEVLLLWCLTTIYFRETGYFGEKTKSSIRSSQEKFIVQPFPKNVIDNFIHKSKKTIELMDEIINLIPPGKFKIIFSAVFVAVYENLNSYNSFLLHKKDINKKLQKTFKKIVKSQQIGGIHYDSYYYFQKRISDVLTVLEPYKVDEKRFLTIKEKIQKYFDEVIKNGGCIKCCECEKVILNWKDINYDHIYAHTNGGKTDIDNTQILCEKCNKKKGKQ